MTLHAGLDPAVIFIGVIVVSIINAIVRSIREKGGTTEAPKDVARPSGADREAERMRKFLEALGVPSNGEPPPIARPVETARPMAVPAAPQPKPTGRRFTPPLPEQGFPRQAMTRLPKESSAESWPPGFPKEAMLPLPPERSRPPVEEFVSVPVEEIRGLGSPEPLPEIVARMAKEAAARKTKVPEEQAVPVAAPTARDSLAALLRDPREQRKAILLREIFGPPRGLQSYS